MTTEELKKIADMFLIEGAADSAVPVGNGYINDTYLIGTTDDQRYILQRINDHVFRDPDALMENIVAVTEHLRGRLAVIPALDRNNYNWLSGGFWRMMTYIEDSFVYESVGDTETAQETGRAYGEFISAFSDFPPESLHETIEGFHDTKRRFYDLHHACEKDVLGRTASAEREIRFALDRESEACILTELAARGDIPLRVTHNDTKLSNVLFDRKTGRAACVIDLDTVMPGLAVTDFGDMVRSGAATVKEDSADTDDISLDIELYRSFARGFIEGFPEMTDLERELMPMGARIMALELGVRFLTDYIEGDHYFKIDYPDHNLIRCRNQFRLVEDIEKKWDLLKI